MITPYSQFVVTQVAINVATGERYKHVIDDLIVFAKGAYAGDRLLGMRRAKALVARERPDVPLAQIRAGTGLIKSCFPPGTPTRRPTRRSELRLVQERSE